MPNQSLMTLTPELAEASRLQHHILKTELIRRYRVFPLQHNEHTLYLGITDPSNHTAISAISFHTGLHIQPILISDQFFEESLLILESATPHYTATTITEQLDEQVITFVDQLLQDAIERTISDIHIEPYASRHRIRFRRDGFLYEVTSLSESFYTRVIARLKLLANLNIAEKRLPQDGKLRIEQRDHLSIRISTCPTLFGEKIVLRIQDANHLPLSISTLGLTTTQAECLHHALEKPQGCILITGPTGSGKTMSLYAALHQLNRIEKNIITIEDPVEIALEGINQVNVHPRIGLDFHTLLRNLLRQDPDVMMIGEIRDHETANMAIQAAQTGHLVLSTLHTNTAKQALQRLQQMEVSEFNLNNAISLIIAQRLLRKLCEHCKQPEKDSHFRPTGCRFCHDGYQGRTGIFELLDLTNANTSTQPSLWEAGLEKVKAGITSDTELTRVLGNAP